MREQGDIAICGARCTRRKVLPRFSPLRRVKGLRPARSYCSVENYNGGGSVGGYAKSNGEEIRSQMVSFIGFSSGVYMDTPDLGLHGDKSESYQLLTIRDLLLRRQVNSIFSRLGLQPSRPSRGYQPSRFRALRAQSHQGLGGPVARVDWDSPWTSFSMASGTGDTPPRAYPHQQDKHVWCLINLSFLQSWKNCKGLLLSSGVGTVCYSSIWFSSQLFYSNLDCF